MKQQTIREWLRETLRDAPGMQEEDYRIYVIRDPAQVDLFSEGGTVFYVGQSQNTYNRLLSHMGLDGRAGASHVGTFIRENAPASGDWLFEQYTLEDCRDHVLAYREQLYGSMDLTHGARAYLITFPRILVDEAEDALIRLYRPCLNTAGNPDPTPLPVHYKYLRSAENPVGTQLEEAFGI